MINREKASKRALERHDEIESYLKDGDMTCQQIGQQKLMEWMVDLQTVQDRILEAHPRLREEIYGIQESEEHPSFEIGD